VSGVVVASLVADNQPWIHLFLNSLAKLRTPVEKYIFVVDEVSLRSKEQRLVAEYLQRELENVELVEKKVMAGNALIKLAILRNAALEAFRETGGGWLTFIDSDLVDFSADILDVLTAADKDVISPTVYIEGTDQFYDTFSFRTAGDLNFAPNITYPPEPFPVESVGSFVVMRRKVAEKVDFPVDGRDGEWVRFCEEARRKKFEVWCHGGVRCYHADLPSHGGKFHIHIPSWSNISDVEEAKKLVYTGYPERKFEPDPFLGELNLKEKSCVLDFGCGVGRNLKRLLELVPDAEVFGYDFVNMIDMAEKNLDGVDRRRVKFVAPPVENLLAYRFDFILASLTFQHIPERDLHEILRVLKNVLSDGGEMAVFGRNWMDDEHKDPWRIVLKHFPRCEKEVEMGGDHKLMVFKK